MEIGEIELNLSLSLNGRFGQPPPRTNENKIARPSSSLLMESPVADEVVECGREWTVQMERSFPLPATHASAEEEGRKKRKEMQSMKRMEVKRRRLEKQRITNGTNLRRPGMGVRFRRRAREPDTDWSRSGSRRRGGSSGVSSESNSQQEKRRKSLALESSPIHRTGTIDTKSAEQMLRSVLEDMPCVCAKFDGPSGGRVEGFLFRYRKGEGIKIVCICHGRFLSPTEFVEHAGGSGSDITNPLKHIIVCPPSW